MRSERAKAEVWSIDREGTLARYQLSCVKEPLTQEKVGNSLMIGSAAETAKGSPSDACKASEVSLSLFNDTSSSCRPLAGLSVTLRLALVMWRCKYLVR